MSNLRHLTLEQLCHEARRSTAFIQTQQNRIKDAQNYIAGEAERLKWIQHYINEKGIAKPNEKGTT